METRGSIMETPNLEVAGCQIEFVNGDGSYLVTLAYRTTKGHPWPNTDRFTFSTVAKLKKFISKNLLAGATDSPEEDDVQHTPVAG